MTKQQTGNEAEVKKKLFRNRCCPLLLFFSHVKRVREIATRAGFRTLASQFRLRRYTNTTLRKERKADKGLAKGPAADADSRRR